MRKLYKELFYIPKHGKIREKVMLNRTFITVAVILLCLGAMSLTAYAYFSYNIASETKPLQAASFETKVSVQITDENNQPVEVITSNYKSHTAQLTAGKTYSVTVQHTDRSTAKTGFMIVTAENCTSRYHTQQLSRDGNGNTETITFRLKPNGDTKVTFLSHWGTSSRYASFMEIGENSELYIINGEEVAISVIGAVTETQPQEETESTEPVEAPTQPETTQPDETVQQTEPESTAATENTAPAETTAPAAQAQLPEAEETQPTEQ